MEISAKVIFIPPRHQQKVFSLFFFGSLLVLFICPLIITAQTRFAEVPHEIERSVLIRSDADKTDSPNVAGVILADLLPATERIIGANQSNAISYPIQVTNAMGPSNDDDRRTENQTSRRLESLDNACNLPFLFLLGPMKSGSSSLFEFLVDHPQICQGLTKEINYIQDDKKLRLGGLEGYRSLFVNPKCPKSKAETFYFIDGSPQFHLLAGQSVADKFAKLYNPLQLTQLKFIVVFREPVAQAYSYYHHFSMVALAEGRPFAQMQTFEERSNNPLTRPPMHEGGYVKELKEFLNHFRRDQILILTAKDLFVNTGKIMRVISNFLKIPFTKEWSEPFPHDNHLEHPRYDGAGVRECVVNFVPHLQCSYRDSLAKHFAPLNEELYALVRNTSSKAFPGEPYFQGFGDEYKKLPCVENSRELYDRLVKSSKKQKCK